MIFYTSDGRLYDGMDQPTVQSMLDAIGNNATFVDEATYNAFIAAIVPPAPTYRERRNAAYPSFATVISALAAKENGDSTAYNAVIASIAATDLLYPVA
jgi:hypothetical protein